MKKSTGVQYLRTLLEVPRYEVLPTASIVDEVNRHVPLGTTITVTASMGMGLERTLGVAEELQHRGYHTVPHLAARMISGRDELKEIVARLSEARVDRVFVPAGDADPAAGDYDGAYDLLRDLSELGSPFSQVGMAGYPERHPLLSDQLTIQAMADKHDLATHVVSNMCFDPSVLTQWVAAIRERGVTLPVLVGVPGQVERAKLLRMATKIGIGESTRFLSKNTSLFARILTPGGYSLERFLQRIVPAFSAPEANVEGLHIYTFNQIEATEKWRRRTLERLEARRAQSRSGRSLSDAIR